MNLTVSSLLRNRDWLLRVVIVPIIITRLALLLIGWYSLELRPNTDYPAKDDVRRGWAFSPYRWLDIWARWDTGWYLSVALDDYQPTADLQTEKSNLAFFPVYPTLARWLAAPLPGELQVQHILLAGVLISNLCLVGICILLYQLSRQLLQDDHQAERAVWYLLLFPSAFMLSAFYTEPPFLFLLLLTFWAAQQGKWPLAGVAGFFLALTRPPGAFALPALLWLYLEQRGWTLRRWEWRRLDRQILWLALIPAGMAVFLFIGYQASGDWLAPIHAQQAWGRGFHWPWVTLLAGDKNHPQFNEVDRISLIVFVLLSFYALFRLPSQAYGIYALLLLVPALVAGELISVNRICLTCFPAFIGLARLGGRWRFLDQLVLVLFLSFQAVLFAGWCQFYWAG